MKIDLFVDLNTADETGLLWTYVDQAIDPSAIVPGRLIVVGAGSAIAIAEVIDVADDGLVHVRPLPGATDRRRAADAILDTEPMPAPGLDEIRWELDELRGRHG